MGGRCYTRRTLPAAIGIATAAWVYKHRIPPAYDFAQRSLRRPHPRASRWALVRIAAFFAAMRSACTSESAWRIHRSIPNGARRRGSHGWLLAAVLCPGLAAKATDIGGTVAINSQLVDRGIAITSRTPVVQGSIYWAPTADWSLELSGAIETRSPEHLLQSGISGSRHWTLSDRWQAQARLSYYRYRYAIDDRKWNVERTEVNVGWTYRETVTLSLSASRMPGGGDIYGAADITVQRSLSEHFALSAGLGIAQPPPFDDGEDRSGHYRYGHAGLIWSQGSWSIELDRVATSANVPRPWGGPRVSPWVATLSVAF